jgi:hypothetical protein
MTSLTSFPVIASAARQSHNQGAAAWRSLRNARNAVMYESGSTDRNPLRHHEY